MRSTPFEASSTEMDRRSHRPDECKAPCYERSAGDDPGGHQSEGHSGRRSRSDTGPSKERGS